MSINLTNDLVVNSICNFIKNKYPLLYDSYNFKYHTQKYTLNDIINAILLFLKNSCSWRNFVYKDIKYYTIQKNFYKLNKFKIFEETYKENFFKYIKSESKGINSKYNKLKYVYTDTTTVYNKYNTDKAKRNKYFKNKKVIKTSLITDSKGIPIDIKIESGNKNDSLILQNQLNELNTKNKNLIKNSTLLADSGYDSTKLTKSKFFKKYIIKPNNRNTKDETKIRELTQKETMIYKKRIIIENTNQKIKSFRRLDVLYEKLIHNYIQCTYLGFLYLLFKYT